MTTLVVDASVAIKWVVDEPDTALALRVRGARQTLAPDLLAAECANILWKKVRRGEIGDDARQAALSALEGMTTQLWPMRGLMTSASDLARRLDHPAYDCFYLALAAEREAPFVTADLALAHKLKITRISDVEVLTLAEAATLPT